MCNAEFADVLEFFAQLSNESSYRILGFSIDCLRVKESNEYGYIRSQNESNNVHNSMTQLAKDQIILVNKNNNSKHK